MVYHHKKNGPVIKGLDMDKSTIGEIVDKIKAGVRYKRIREDYKLSYYFLKIIERKFT